MSIRSEAERLLGLGFSVIPVSGDKRPLIKWDTYKTRLMDKSELSCFDKAEGIAIVCGEVSGNLECIDLDVKYDIDGSCDDFLSSVINYGPVIQQTPSGGYHVIYRTTQKPEGNKKIAGRSAIFGEDGSKFYFIESRGEGGYFLVSPSPGYDLGGTDLATVPEIDWDTRCDMFNFGYSLNNLIEEKKVDYNNINSDYDGWIKTPGDDYSDRVSIRSLFESNGWTFVKSHGSKDFYRRPGGTSIQNGNWDNDRKWFTVFTPNTCFEVQKAYRAWHIYTELEHGGDYKKAVKQLIADGYGVKLEEPPKIKIVTDLSKVISDPEKDHKDIESYISGDLKGGLLTGNTELDEYYRFKENFTIINGHMNVGKSRMMWFLAAVAAFRYDWKWLINTTENKSRWIRMALYEMICQKRIHDTNFQERKWAYEWVNSHFTIINGSDFDFTAFSFVDMCVDICAKDNDIKGVLMDPYNSLLIDDKIKYSSNKHEYDYSAVSYMRRMSIDCNKAFWLNTHTTTEAQRKRDSKTGFQSVPYAADSEGGSKFANRADDFITIHRYIDHPDDWMWTQIYIRKIKEQELGGKPTRQENPIRMKYSDGGFVNSYGYSPLTFDYKTVGSPNDYIPKL